METHNYGMSHEHGIATPSWAGTYGFCVMKHGVVDPDDVYQGGIPVLLHGPDLRDPIFWDDVQQ